MPGLDTQPLADEGDGAVELLVHRGGGQAIHEGMAVGVGATVTSPVETASARADQLSGVPFPGNDRLRSTKSVATYSVAGALCRTRMGSASSTKSAVPSSKVMTTGPGSDGGGPASAISAPSRSTTPGPAANRATCSSNSREGRSTRDVVRPPTR